jgi:uncharacterized protein YcgI (DUF1989 family)
MAGTRVEAMPTLPAAADDAPAGVVWEETIAPGGYAARRLARGTRLRLVDVAGDACAAMLLFNADMPTERLNVADTLKVQWNGYLGAGRLLLSDMGRVMMTIVEDGADTHDAFCGASTAASNARAYGDGANYGPHPNARDRFMLAVAKHGLGRKDVGPFAPGRTLLLRAEMEVIVVLANCPHVLDPRPDYTVTPLRATAWRGAPAAADDPIRVATPEGERAFLNTDDFYAR